MQGRIVDYLLNLGVTEDDIENILKSNNFELVEFKQIRECINLLIVYGYPKEDVSTLLSVNPYIMFYNPTNLEKLLIGLSPNLEEKLKENPYLI